MTEPVLIRRYGGSRLHDTVRGCYVTSAMLRAWAKRRIRFVVRDAATGVDLTSGIINRVV